MTFEQFNISHTIKSIAFNEPPETTEREHEPRFDQPTRETSRERVREREREDTHTQVSLSLHEKKKDARFRARKRPRFRSQADGETRSAATR